MNGMATQKKQEAPLLPVYLIVGEDALKRDTVMKRLRARLSSMGDLSFNADEFDGETAQGGDIVTACNTVPFASPVRLVEVRAADKLKKADAEQLVSYLGSPNGSTVLALVAEKLAKNTRLYKAVAACGKTAVIDCAPLKRYELPRTVRSMAVTHGVTLTEGAAVKLVDLVGEDTVHLDSELKKIALAHRGTDAVNEHEIVDMVRRGEALGVRRRLCGARRAQVPAVPGSYGFRVAPRAAGHVHDASARACLRALDGRSRQSPRRGRGAQSARLAREEPCQLGPRLHCRRTAARHHLFA